MSGDTQAEEGDDACRSTGQCDDTTNDLAALLGQVARLTQSQRRMDLDLRRLDLDVQRLDATVQLMGTSVSALSDDVRQLGTYVRRLETKLDLSRQLLDTHLHTIMKHIDVPLLDTFHSDYWDSRPGAGARSPAPGQVGG